MMTFPLRVISEQRLRRRRAKPPSRPMESWGVDTRQGYTRVMRETATYSVPARHCAHCERTVREELLSLHSVDTVDVDLDLKVVTVTGEALDDAALRAAIVEAGYEAA
jgi:copper chaperone